MALVGDVRRGHIESPSTNQSGRDLVRVTFDDNIPFVRHNVDQGAERLEVLVGLEHFSEPLTS